MFEVSASVSASKSPALTFCVAIATTLAFVHVPITVPLFGGHRSHHPALLLMHEKLCRSNVFTTTADGKYPSFNDQAGFWFHIDEHTVNFTNRHTLSRQMITRFQPKFRIQVTAAEIGGPRQIFSRRGTVLSPPIHPKAVRYIGSFQSKATTRT